MMFHPGDRPNSTVLRLIAGLLTLLAAIGLLFLLSPRRLAAQSGVRSAAILLLKGNDTLVVERIQRGPTNVIAIVAMKGLPSTEIVLTLGADHHVIAATYTARGANAPADAAPLQIAEVTFDRDSALLEIRGGGVTRSPRIATKPGALPIVNNDFTTFEQAVRIARATRVSTLVVPVFLLSGGQTLDATLELVGSDSARFTLGGNVTEASIDQAGNVTGGRIPAAGIEIHVVVGAAAAGISMGKPDYSAPAAAPYTAEEVRVATPAGHALTGTLTLPRTGAVGARMAAVVTITGSGAQDRDEYIPVGGGYRLFRQVADTLGRRGIAVLRLDDRGVGGSGGDAGGTSAAFADDIRAAVAYLRTRPEIDPARIALVGHSEGGAIAPMVAATDARLAAMVLMAGTAYDGRSIIDYQLRNQFAVDTALSTAQRDSATKASIAAFDTTAGRQPWMKYFLAYDPLPTARRVKQPTLILQGATDQQVRPEEARMLDEAMRDAGNRRVTMRIFADRNHLFLRDPNGHPSGYARLTEARIDAEVMGTLADWLVTTLAEGQGAPTWATALDSLVIAELARTRTPGAQVAVVVDGKLIYTKGYGVADLETGRTVTDRTLFRVGSVTKVVTGSLLAQLMAEGKLDPSAPISKYVTELAGRRVGTVTTQQLLTHNAGWLDNAVPYGRMGEGALGEVMREVGDTLFFAEPGRVLSYSNPGYSMAGYVAERAGGARYATQVDLKILRPLAMPRATFRPLEALTYDFSQGHIAQGSNAPVVVRPFTENTAQWAAGFLMTSAGELANLAIALMDGGMFDGKRVLAAEAVTRVTTAHVPTPAEPGAAYGYGLVITKSGAERVWRHGGSINGFDASLTMFPDRKLAVLVFDNRSGAPLQGIVDLVAQRAAGIAPAPTPTQPAEREANATERAQLTGTFKMGATTVEIFELSGALRLRQGQSPEAELRLVGDDRLVVLIPTGARATMTLVRGADGRVEFLHQGMRSLARQR